MPYRVVCPFCGKENYTTVKQRTICRECGRMFGAQFSCPTNIDILPNGAQLSATIEDAQQEESNGGIYDVKPERSFLHEIGNGRSADGIIRSATCWSCGSRNPTTNRHCGVCGAAIEAHGPQTVPPNPWYKNGWYIFTLICVIVVAIALVAASMWEPVSAELTVTGFDYEYDYWSDTIHVWGSVKNEGNGWTDSWESITVYVTVWFDHQPYAHEIWLFDQLGPGESQFFERTWDVPFTLDSGVSVYADFDKVTWYNDS